MYNTHTRQSAFGAQLQVVGKFNKHELDGDVGNNRRNKQEIFVEKHDRRDRDEENYQREAGLGSA